MGAAGQKLCMHTGLMHCAHPLHGNGETWLDGVLKGFEAEVAAGARQQQQHEQQTRAAAVLRQSTAQVERQQARDSSSSTSRHAFRMKILHKL
jgi:hypothetical protein